MKVVPTESVTAILIDSKISRRSDSIEGREARGGRTDRVLQADPHQGGTLDPFSEVHRVEITQRLKGPLSRSTFLGSQPRLYLFIIILACQLEIILPVAEPGNVCDTEVNSGIKSSRSES